MKSRSLASAVAVVATLGIVGVSMPVVPVSAAQPVVAESVSGAPGTAPSLRPSPSNAHGADTSPEGLAIGQAKASGKRVEVTNDRTETSATFANPDGSITRETDVQPRFVKAATGYVPVDPTLHVWEGRLVPGAVPGSPTFSDGGSGTLAKASLAGGTMSVSWPGTLPKPNVAGDTATYVDVSPGVDLVVKASNTGFEESLVYKRRVAALVTSRLRFHLTGLKVKDDGAGGLTLLDGSGAAVGSVPAGTVYDSGRNSAGDPSHQAVLPANPLTLAGKTLDAPAADTDISITPDTSFMSDPSVQYPVTVDPSTNLSMNYWALYRSNSGTVWNTSTQTANVGYSPVSGQNPANVNRSDFSFDWSPIDGAYTMTSAVLQTNINYIPAGSVATNINVYNTNEVCKCSWPGPSHGPTVQAYISNNSTGPQNFTLTTFFQNNAPNQTGSHVNLELQNSDEAAATKYRKFDNNPRLAVTYNHKPYDLIDQYVNNELSTNYVASTTVTLFAYLQDPDASDVLTATVTVKDHVTGSVVASGPTSGVYGSGGWASYVVPGLTSERQYDWTISNITDGYLTNTGSWNGDTFTPDTTRPGTPTLSCDIANGAWSLATTINCPITSGGGNMSYYTYSVDGGAPSSVGVDGSGNSYISPSGLSAGSHTLSVTAYDLADNSSTGSATWSWGTANGGLSKPVAGTRTQQFVTLESTFNSGTANQVIYKYGLGSAATTAIPVTDMTIAGSGTHPASPMSISTSPTVDLVWNLTSTLGGASAPDGLVQIQACFQNSGTPVACSPLTQVQYLRHAFGASYAHATVGPATVALATGDSEIQATDATLPTYLAPLKVGRTFTTLKPRLSGDPASSSANSVFGPGWTANLAGDDAGEAEMKVTDTSGTNGTITFTGSDGASEIFYRAGGGTGDGTFSPTGDASSDGDLVTKSGTTLTRADRDGTTTAWTGSGSAWTVTSVLDANNSTGANSQTSYHFDTSGRLSQIIAPIPAGVSTGTGGCAFATSLASLPNGCREVSFTYASSTTATGTGSTQWGDYNTQLASIQYSAYDPSTSAMLTNTVAQYKYDNTGYLRCEYDPQVPSSDCSHSATTYGYVTGSDGLIRLQTLTPSGLNGWTLAYDATGRLLSATVMQPTSVSPPTATTATTNVVYSVDLGSTATASSYPDLNSDSTASTPSNWNEITDLPVAGNATAIFPPDHIPTGGGTAGTMAAVASGDWKYGSLTYMDAAGRAVNTASYGAGAWQIQTAQYDQLGNVTFGLSAQARNEALAATSPDSAVNGYSTSAQRASLLGTITAYSTAASAQGLGTVQTDSWGPVSSIQHADGSGAVDARAHTATTYDENAPNSDKDANNNPFRLATTNTTSACVINPDTSCTTSTVGADTRVETLGYDPNTSAGGTSGWVLRKPTTSVTRIDGGTNDVWEQTSYDSLGRVIESRQPSAAHGGTDSSAATTKTAYYTADSSGGATCGSKPAYAGLVCQITAAGQPTDVDATHPALTVTTTTAYNRLAEPTTVTEVSGSTTRTTTTGYDAAGRTISYSEGTSGDSSVAISSQYTSYDTTKGLTTCTSTAAGCTGSTTPTTYNGVGQVETTADVHGSVTTTTYDVDGRVASVVDAKGTTTYTYDSTTEHRGLVTAEATGLGGSPDFAATYDGDGKLITQTYPNGLTTTDHYDDTGFETQRVTNFGASQTWSFTQSPNAFGQIAQSGQQQSTNVYTYDNAGRLTAVADKPTGSSTTTTRTYSYDTDSNRLGETNSGVSVQTHTYDQADRLIDAGYTYDTLGRTTTVPATDSGGSGPLSLSYFANDLVQKETQAVTTTSTLGLATPGPSIDYPGYNAKFGSIYTATDNGTATRFRFEAIGGPADQVFTPVIYSVSGGVPQTLLATGAEVTIHTGQPAAFVTSALPSIALTAGTSYYLGLLSGPTTNGAGVYYTSVTNANIWNTNYYPTPTTTFGTPNYDSHQYSFAVDYNVLSSQVVGNPAAGANVDNPGANAKFGSIFTAPSNGTASDFRFEAAGGANSQVFTPVVYSVSGGVPQTLLATGTPVTIAAGQPFGSVTSTLSTLTLTAGTSYYLGLLSGGTTGSASVYYDTVTNANIWNSNTYPTPTTTFGTPNYAPAQYSFAVDYALTPETKTMTLDPLYRLDTSTTVIGSLTTSTTQHYDNNASEGSEAPAWTETSAGTWTRNIQGIDGMTNAQKNSDGTVNLMISDLRGNIVASIPNTANAYPTTETESTEFGLTRSGDAALGTTGPDQYGWHGAQRRDQDSLGLLTLMGERLYNPTTGRFLQTDPIPGGSCNAYDYACQDPLNQNDLNGQYACCRQDGGGGPPPPKKPANKPAPKAAPRKPAAAPRPPTHSAPKPPPHAGSPTRGGGSGNANPGTVKTGATVGGVGAIIGGAEISGGAGEGIGEIAIAASAGEISGTALTAATIATGGLALVGVGAIAGGAYIIEHWGWGL